MNRPKLSADEANLPDGYLIARVLDGHPESFTELVRRYQRPLLRLGLSRLGKIDMAEDAVQETFLCAFNSLHSYDSRYSFRTWLWTILINQCRRHLKATCRRPATNFSGDARDVADDLESSETAPMQRVMKREQSDLLQRLLDELPKVEAEALRLRFCGEMKFTEIADAMSCSLPTAKNRVRRGLERLSEQLRGKDDNSSYNALKSENS